MPPKRARKPKSHRGCTACRASKRKCTEDKPACENCIRDGKVCEYDVDALFRIQTYDGTQQPNRRMRQIINPLPEVALRQKPTGTCSSVNSSPAGSPIIDASSRNPYFSQHHFTTETSTLHKRSSPTHTDAARQLSFQPIYTLATGAGRPQSQVLRLPAVDFSSLTATVDHSISPSSMSLNSYGLAMTDVIDPAPVNIASSMTGLSDGELVSVGLFLQELPSLLPFSELFPSVCNEICVMSVTHIPLTQSILAVASHIADRRTDNSPSHGTSNFEEALVRVQDAISVGVVDEGIIAAVFLLALLSTLNGDYKNARQHLQGMCRLLQSYHQRRACCVPSHPSPFNTNSYSIIMLLWRMAVRMEYHVASYDSGQGEPIFPITETSQEETQVEWISQIIDRTFPDGVSWALASFALDNLMNRASHLLHKLSALRIGFNDQELQMQELIKEHRNWKHRPIVIQATIESLSSPPDSTIDPSFMHAANAATLQYQRIRIQNKFYATLLLRHFMTGIYLSLIANTCPGPISPKQFQFAINICRYFVALYGDPPYPLIDPLLRPVDSCLALITTGFTLHDHELGYRVRTLTAIARETGFTALLGVVEILKAVYEGTNCEGNWGKEYQNKTAMTPWLGGDEMEFGSLNDFKGLGRLEF